jgi:hypothetical protein
VIGLVGWTELAAQATFIHMYRFQPDVSRLQINGGFAGFDLDYAIQGTFGLVIHQTPHLPITFGFTDVRARLVGEPPFHGLPLDPLIGMSNWTGTLSNPFTIDFVGVDGQHAPMNVTGTLGNVVLLLDGANKPPCCDFFDYQLDAAAQIFSLTPFLDVDAWTSVAGRGPLPPVSESSIRSSQVPEPVSATLLIGMALLLCRQFRRV